MKKPQTINLTSGNISLTLEPRLGGIMTSCKFDGTEVIYTPEDNQTLLGNPSYCGSLLFPFPNRIAHGKYTYLGKSYQLRKNEETTGHALHGLLAYKEWSMVEELSNSETAFLRYDYDAEHAGYPFHFTAEVKYTIIDSSEVRVTLFINNRDVSTIPVGFGWHPYFTLGGTIDNYHLKIPSLTHHITDSAMIPKGKTQLYAAYSDSKKIDSDVFDTCFESVSSQDLLRLSLATDDCQLNYWQETGTKKFSFLQLYTPPHRLAIAIEPQTCCIDAFNNKQGLIDLRPHESISASCGFKLTHF